jgi:hypothetical protein
MIMYYYKIKNNPQWSIWFIAFLLLTSSCNNARTRGLSKVSKYKNIKCDLTGAVLRDALMKQDSFWNEWVRLTKEWVENGYKYGERTTLDRIDNNGHYVIGNIQALPYKKNVSKNKGKKCLILFYNENWEISRIKVIWGLNRIQKTLGVSKNRLNHYISDKPFVDYVCFEFESQKL